MNTQHLSTYLSDHIALSVAGIELAKRCYSSNNESELGEFFADLIPKLEHEQQVLKTLLHKLEISDSPLKNAAAWAAEKVGRLKPNDSLLRYSPLSRVVELETLSSGLNAQILMWNALGVCIPDEPAFSDIECAWFVKENTTYWKQLERFHQDAIYKAFVE
jgi:hypothetical protein